MSKDKTYLHTSVELIEHTFNKVNISNYDFNEINLLYKQFNKSNDKNEKYNIALKLPNGIFPLCRFCGKLIVNSNFRLKLLNNEIYLVQPYIYCREINNVKYYLSCCEDCLLSHFKDNKPKSQKYYFMKANIYGHYSYGYPDDLYKKICSMTVAVTEKSMKNKYGEIEGELRWKKYCKTQSEKKYV